MDVTTLRGRRADQRWNRLSIGDTLERRRWSEPDAEVLTAYGTACESEEHRRLTVARADDLANQFANGVLGRGIEPGSVVMLLCENSVEAFLVKIGLAKVGVTVAPVNPKLATDVVLELVELVGPAGVVLDAAFVDAVLPAVTGRGVEPLAVIGIGGSAVPSELPSFADFVREQSPAEPDVAVHGDDIWQILFTSGSTATPKGVMVSHANTVMAAMSFTSALHRGVPYDSDLVTAAFLPVVYHVGDVIPFCTLLNGGRVVVGRGIDPPEIARAIAEETVTSLWAGAPQVITNVDAALRAAPELDASTLRSVVFGFAPLDPAGYGSFRERVGEQVRAAEIIGQTEVVCSHRFWLDEHEELYSRAAPQQNYVGLPHALMASSIRTAEGKVLPAGSTEIGEAAYRSPALAAGYYRQPEATEAAWREGWFHGGDAFQYGESGQRMLVDRFKDIVKTGGENVSSIRVEGTLQQHPAVERAAVVGLPHPRWSEAVTGIVKLAPDARVDEEELLRFARERLAGFETPKRILFVDEFPLAVGNKIQKHVLRRTFASTFDGTD
jgi:acyl-CoA synthetase (AMP-forming)/AMP-acid ligase II